MRICNTPFFLVKILDHLTYTIVFHFSRTKLRFAAKLRGTKLKFREIVGQPFGPVKPVMPLATVSDPASELFGSSDPAEIRRGGGEREREMAWSATMVGALLGLGTQMYSNALRKLPYMRRMSNLRLLL